jgi:hypothetical protein
VPEEDKIDVVIPTVESLDSILDVTSVTQKRVTTTEKKEE